jgi:PAS domain S-box-containing protein
VSADIAVLLVDDELGVGTSSATFLERVHPNLTVADVVVPDEALRAVADREPDCVVVAVRRAGRVPIALVETLRRDRPDVPVVVFAPGGTETLGGTDLATLESAVAARVAVDLTDLPCAIEFAVAERRATDAVAAPGRTLRGAVDALDRPFLVADETGHLLTWNRAVREVTGHEGGTLSTATVAGLVVARDAESVQSALAEAVAAGRSCVRASVRRSDGAVVPFELAMSRIDLDGPDDALGVCVVGTDVARRREERQQLAVLHRILRHNVRNSLNVVMGKAQDLADASPDLAADLAPVMTHARRILDVADEARLVSDVVDGGGPSATSRDLVPIVERALAEAVPPDVTVVRDLPDSAYASLEDRADAAVGKLVTAVVDRVRRDAFPDGGTEDGLVGVDGREDPGDTPSAAGDERDEREGGRGRAPGISVAVESGPAGVVLSVAGGPPLAGAERTILEAGVETPLAHGEDLCLWLVHWLVARSGGTIRVRDDPERGEFGCGCVVVEFPPGSSATHE